MKNTLVIAMLIFNSTHYANAYDVENIRSFLKKSKKCSFAVYKVMIDKKTRNSLPQRFYVTCIGDIVLNPNTIKEKKGCGAFGYDVETGSIEDLTTFGPNIAEGKTCDAGGFETVLDQFIFNETYSSGGKYRQRKIYVKDFFKMLNAQEAPYDFYRLVVYSDNDSQRTILGYSNQDVDLKNVDFLKKK